MESGQWPRGYPLKRHDSHVAEQMVARAAGLARDSHARTRHAALLMKNDSMLGWGINGVPFPGEDHCYCKFAGFGHHDMCRTHAEQRAITLAREGDGWRLLSGAKLIYVRLETDDSVRLERPHFCPRCSRLALSLGVSEWIFALSEGLVGYSAADYDAISQLGWLYQYEPGGGPHGSFDRPSPTGWRYRVAGSDPREQVLHNLRETPHEVRGGVAKPGVLVVEPPQGLGRVRVLPEHAPSLFWRTAENFSGYNRGGPGCGQAVTGCPWPGSPCDPAEAPQNLPAATVASVTRETW